jgi:hypothetical protein
VSARLTSAVLVSGLTRRAFALGGSAAVLAKGDPEAGSILLLIGEKGVVSGLWERILAPTGAYCWAKNELQDIENKEKFSNYLDRRRIRDPDLWLIELDVPNAERFTAELTALD